jgi:hypothetical protein
MNELMCPHCGKLVRPGTLVPVHDWPILCRQMCPGSGQIPRNPESDARPLWNGERNEHFAG